jgi:hypothetical protein
VIGLDVGQVHDPSAIAVVERAELQGVEIAISQRSSNG